MNNNPDKLLQRAYVERDVSWMHFNHRILQEAQKTTIPAFERLNFLGIYSNNLDEFFRVRVASLNRVADSKDKALKRDRERAKKTIKEINRLNNLFNHEFERSVDEVFQCLREHNVFLLHETDLDELQKDYIKRLYIDRLNGITNPVWLSEIKEITDDGIYLGVKCTLEAEGEEKRKENFALVKIPRETGRFVKLPSAEGVTHVMYIDDVIRYCLPFIFIGCGRYTFEAFSFKVTKDAEMEMDNDLDYGVLQKVAHGVKSRKSGEPIRMIYDASMPRDLLKKVMNRLNIDQLDTIVSGGRYQDHKDLMGFPACGPAEMHYPTWRPIVRPSLETSESLLDTIRRKDRFIHVPYHSFSSFIRLLREAAIRPDVKEIKATLYRLAKDSKVVNTLICAARNGKKVTVVIELLARFDEESNIKWSKRMQEAGIEVVFGVEGLKIHSKLVHIKAKGGDIACIGTGNFHEGNAKMYTDYLLMTARPKLTREVERVFDFINKPFHPVRFNELLVSPNEMKTKVLRMMDTEIRNARNGDEAWIKIKINHITDIDIITKLYEASQAGVRIDIVIRGNCSLVPGIPGVSENIKAVGIIDRYLEHSRILIFAGGGNPRYFMGSADWMPRNLENRIEVLTPVYDKDLQHDLMRTVDYGLADTVNGRLVDRQGSNVIQAGEPFRSQEQLYEDYLAEAEVEQ